MSSSSSAASAATPSSSSGTANYFTNLGLGYPIAIALGFLVLLSILLLASYICCRASRASYHSSSSSVPSNLNPNPNHDGIILPRIIFVAEDEDDDADGRRGDLDDGAVVGLHQSVINSYPKFPYERDGAGIKESTCSICLCEYKASEMLRMMPECRHCFHLCCLDAWLKLNGSCPVCRNSPLPTPLSTPLQEVVPLSQFAADRRRSR
ncbi:RING-H2 finger protein ATL68 [Morus notabilis]|uniref:RING-H2 finger protein ATL68 n=1 Tax=Morus notabilis TaxID=981085 RepID=W9QS51_9ROSA|nr:RING-H2 finger protein ATL67 [Morus notabilis]EXB52692.1 RING-H2 finger protein ATL68 [Morus notabilis]